jgi:hypothetical protein
VPRCLDVEQVLASSRCTASFRHNHGTACRAVLDVLQVLASSHCTGCLASAGIFFALFTASFPHNHGTLCRAVLDVLQVLASSRCTASCRQNPAPCAALCWIACKCSPLRAAPEVFITATPCAALCWMSCKCSHLREAPDLFVKGKHPMPNVSEPLRAECVRTSPYIHKQKCFVFA